MTKMLAIELAEHEIRVNAVAPGTIETPSRAPGLADPVRRQVVLGRGRFGTAEEIAAVICYLASPGAAYVTGIPCWLTADSRRTDDRRLLRYFRNSP
jgi:NAD(P)-dependent dehydrogenase (short-subunit alcohol dehydrogenase family)